MWASGRRPGACAQTNGVVLKERTQPPPCSTPTQLYGPGDLGDLPWPICRSFSLHLGIPALRGCWLRSRPKAVVLVKPQFEGVGGGARPRVGKGGVVRENPVPMPMPSKR